ncbi:MAG: rhamnogalacturonan acetylesterase [Treponema sp.]|nr:rhamnogalacturonan acetylesterase [Treponema sp.]
MRIFFAGDSTAQYNDASTFPQSGIAQQLETFFNPAQINDDSFETLDFINKKVELINMARNGRSTKSFIAEKRLTYIEKNINAGDFLFVMFGHNDEKLHDPKRGTLPFDEFQKNLFAFAQVAFNASAFPLFITPVARRKFEIDKKSGHKIAVETHGEYPFAMKECAQKLNIPCIDLSELSRNKLTHIGEEKSRALYMNFDSNIYDIYPDGKDDNTHLTGHGAYTFAKIIASEIRKLTTWKNSSYSANIAYAQLAQAVCISHTIDYTECTNAD